MVKKLVIISSLICGVFIAVILIYTASNNEVEMTQYSISSSDSITIDSDLDGDGKDEVIKFSCGKRYALVINNDVSITSNLSDDVELLGIVLADLDVDGSKEILLKYNSFGKIAYWVFVYTGDDIVQLSIKQFNPYLGNIGKQEDLILPDGEMNYNRITGDLTIIHNGNTLLLEHGLGMDKVKYNIREIKKQCMT